MHFVERNTRTAYRIEGLQRQEITEYPSGALREAITNAVMHRDWFFDGANVFVEVYSDRIEVVSPGGLPRGLSLGNLGSRSIRRNALIADLLHRIGFIEKAGTGILRIREEAREEGCPDPAFEANGFVTVTFRPNPVVRAGTGAGDAIAEGTWTDHVTDHVRKLVATLTGEMDRAQLQAALQLTHRAYFRSAYLRPALETGLIEMTVPDKPNSPGQRYRVTRKGREFLRKTRERTEASDASDGGGATDHVTDQATDQATDHVTDHVRQLVMTLTGEMDRAQLQAALQLTHRHHFTAAYIRPALEAGLIEMTFPEKPRSRHQRYRLTWKGRELLKTVQQPRPR